MSAGSWASHLALGCVKVSATGADCSAGMVGAATEQLFVAGLTGPRPAEGTDEYKAWKEENSRNLALASAFAGYVFSGGKGQNVTAVSDYAVSAFQNNYLNRQDKLALEKELAECEKQEGGTCTEAWRIFEKYKDISTKRDFELSILCGNDASCVQRELNSIATDGWDDIAARYSTDFDNFHNSIRPGEYAQAYINTVVSGQGTFSDQFMREVCGGVYDAVYSARMDAAQAQMGVIVAGGIVVVGGAVLIGPELAAACLVSPVCRMGLTAAEMVYLTACAIDPDPLCALPGPSPTTVKKLAQEANPFATNADEAVFWSVKTEGVGGVDVACALANKCGGTTLEQLLAARGFQLPAWDASNPSVVKAWEEASRSFASGASGDVTAVLGSSLRPGNVWETVELPTLLANPKITCITTIDPKTGLKTVIFEK